MTKKVVLSIIIPVYNESKTLKKVLGRVYNYQIPNVKKELIIVESNSTDNSREIVKRFAQAKKDVTLILEEKPQGKGHAVREGLKKATGDIILIQDADLEYEVSDYPNLLKPILEGKTKFVLGSRHLDHAGNYNWSIRKFKERKKAFFMNIAGHLFHTFFNIVYQTNLTDPTTMYKIFKRECLDNLHLKGNYFDLDWEIVAKLIRSGYKPIEVPVHYKPRGFAEGKKINIMRDGPRYVKAIIENRILPLNKL
ncbi:MAG: hypothetical protein A2Y57_01555 [Candidatus Woykebacteria bacterium RBG_13_40_7b]|uniref:Glycosyltransferase 2-like domain-containing protein n=1 Tax=Candidatus Woykebacteria bacterium RBG_13_40_7b TaxID=1802594 RepID=A0A1G1W786_9BACT|nr:MAG: hypothetical protein A2Y57_01555 [Candidatus Woykebacteria bacterium RBG_13_40_7b]